MYEGISSILGVYLVDQMYINKDDICGILYLVCVGWVLFLLFLQTINMCMVSLIITIFFLSLLYIK